ncbi:MAG: histidinol-phosphate aminotransferase family protein [Chloroflexi bacterium]|nr:histidinol-phosphate aminotransferase family protein [Chloroflexota bacterium]
MSPSPVTFAHPSQPASYSWEATSEAVAERYGLPVESIARFDLNTVTAPSEVAERAVRAGRFEVPISEYPPSDYRRLVAAAAARYGCDPAELLVGAGADEILDLVGKAFIPPGGRAIVPTPSYAMFGVVTSQRGATVVAVPRRPAGEGFALDGPAIRHAAARDGGADLIWLCDPNNPTALSEPEGSLARLLDELAADATMSDRRAPVVVLDEAYAEFVDRSQADLRFRYPRLVVVRTLSKAYALAGLRVGFALARPAVIEEIAVYRPPGSVSVVSIAVGEAVLLDDTVAPGAVARLGEERQRFAAGLTAAGWSVLPSMTNFLLVDLGSPARAADVTEGLLRQGLVPRTFPAEHPLAAYLRLTVRDREQDDRLIAAAQALAAR